MQIKEATTFEAQMELIKSKGFVISKEDETNCINFLQKTNYYRLSAYFLPFRNKDKTFFSGVKFSRIQEIYEFDSQLRGLVFSVIEDIEINLRTKLAYHIAHKYGPLGYLSEDMFSRRHNKEKFEKKIKSCIEENKNSLVVKHHKANYDGKFPIWVIIEFFSVGMLSYFYKDMKSEDKKVISAQFNTVPKQMESWLRCLTDLRNRCAHYSRLYYWIFPALPKMEKNTAFCVDRKLFTQLMVLKYLYPSSEKWDKSFVTPLNAVIEKYSQSITLNHIGFCEDWEKILSADSIEEKAITCDQN